MMEKVILAIAVTFSLYWSIEIKPTPRFVGIEIDSQIDTFREHQPPILLTL